MEESMRLLFLVVLVAACACDARELASPDHWGTNTNTTNSDTFELSGIPVCALCQEYTALALDHLNQDKTQNEIIEILHNTCHQLHSLNQKCIALVDHYAHLFFLEIATIQPDEFCSKAKLCKHIAKISLQVQENSCEFCKDTVSTLLAKLKDPDTELDIIETLLKVCNSVEKFAYKCKRLVFEYGPLVVVNAEKFLETTDICTAVHACKASPAVNHEAFLSYS